MYTTTKLPGVTELISLSSKDAVNPLAACKLWPVTIMCRLGIAITNPFRIRGAAGGSLSKGPFDSSGPGISKTMPTLPTWPAFNVWTGRRKFRRLTMWALCHSPLLTEAETALRAAIRERSVANVFDSEAPKLFGEDPEPDLFGGESFSSHSARNGPMTTRSPTARLPLREGQRCLFQPVFEFSSFGTIWVQETSLETMVIKVVVGNIGGKKCSYNRRYPATTTPASVCLPLLDANGSKDAGRPKTSSIWNRQAGCSGFNARPTKSWDVGAGGIGSCFKSACKEQIPVPFAALVMT